MRRVSSLAFGVFLCATACSRPAPSSPKPLAIADAPYELADTDDLAALDDRYRGLPRAERGALRAQLSAEYRRRAVAALDDGDQERAYQAFTRLIRLFDRPDDLANPPAPLREAAALATRLRAEFASRGGDREAALALFTLAAINPDVPRYLDELTTIFAYSDELAVAEFGPGAERSRPIEILESVVAVAPFPAATERLLALYRERHGAVDAIIRSGNLSYELIGAHGQGVLRTSWHIVRVHALAGTLAASLGAIEDIKGFGDDPELKAALAKALSSSGVSEAIALADRFAGSEEDGRDLDAAQAVIAWALESHPAHPALLRKAGVFAADNDQVDRGIRLLEAGHAGENKDRAAAEELAELYEFRVTTLSLTGRPGAARAMLARFEALYGKASKRWSGFKPDLANAYAAMGRGLLSLGDLDNAETILTRSLGARATLEALEHLGTLALRRDQFDRAAALFEKALKLPAADPSVRFNRAKLMRLAGEALIGADKRDRAHGMFLEALEEWRALRTSETYELRPPFAAEALIESGKLLWHLGKQDVALTAFAAAQDVAPGDANAHAAIVSFLVVRDRYSAALDAYHRALGSPEVSDYFKVYMSLWILAESRRAGIEVDPFVRDFLASRDGRLWYDDLARFASGRAGIGPLEKKANTRARRAELLYYSAVLGSEAKSAKVREALLRDVLASEMIMFFEYEMAKHWLERGTSSK